MLEEIEPKVRAVLGATRELPEVWVVEQAFPPGWNALTSSSLIALGPGSREHEDCSLAHELAHWYWQGTGLELPAPIEEGLAEVIKRQALPARARIVLEQHRWGLAGVEIHDFERLLLWTAADLSAGGTAEEHRLTLAARAIGFVIADRIGVEGLRKLCQQARLRGDGKIPASELLAASGLDLDAVDTWLEPSLDSSGSLCLKTTFSDATGATLGAFVANCPGAIQVPSGAVCVHVMLADCPK